MAAGENSEWPIENKGTTTVPGLLSAEVRSNLMGYGNVYDNGFRPAKEIVVMNCDALGTVQFEYPLWHVGRTVNEDGRLCARILSAKL